MKHHTKAARRRAFRAYHEAIAAEAWPAYQGRRLAAWLASQRGGRRVVQKLSVGAIPCPACRPPQREPCRYCLDTGAMRDGRPCEGIDCAARGGVR